MEKELLQKCNLIAQNASIVARDEIRLFCRIMGYPKNEHNDFIGGDPHGVVAIQEDYMFFNMSDIHVVLKEYERWLKIYGDNKGIRKAVEQWYYYCIDWHEKHRQFEWHDAEKELPNKFVNNGSVQDWSEDVVVCYGTSDYTVGFYHYKTKQWYRSGDIDDSEMNEYIFKWAYISKPDDTYCPNLRSWLAGCPVPGLREATEQYKAEQAKSLEESRKRTKEAQEAFDKYIAETKGE